MDKTTAAVALCLAASACNQPDSSTSTAEPARPAATEAPAPSASATPRPAPTTISTTAPPVLTPEAEKGEKGARNVLIEWARAVENGDWRRAAAQFGGNGTMSATELEARLSRFGRATVSVGAGQIEGAAGSSYYSAPVSIAGNGRKAEGEIVLRRVNDVPGATAEQLRWHIERLTGLP